MGPSLGLVALLAVCVAGLQSAATPVTCGSAIKLQHTQTKYRLHSHEIAYGSGSGQQSVTGFPDGDDGNSLWTVLCADKPHGSKVSTGQHVRLQHLETKKYLHSHNHRSPLSGNQEVSCYGDGAGASNSNDVWRVETEDDVWLTDERVSLLHVDTGVWLASHAKAFPRPIAGQHEVFGGRARDRSAEWQAAEGVYFQGPGVEDHDL